MSWFDILKTIEFAPNPNTGYLDDNDTCCRKIRSAMKNSPDWNWNERYDFNRKAHNCKTLRAYLEKIAGMEPTDEGYDFNRKASASRLLAAWAECERLKSNKPIAFDEKTQQEWA
jgi:hypothetical protein|tara:strand:+ start:4087 stop:4431 length:345 start_codon:yes stop_codon:yes gene_type:complete